jgi:hypothetical protein
MQPKPSIGRIVHYLSDPAGTPQAALVVNVISDDCIDLVTWNAGGTQSSRSGIVLGDKPGQWMWPPKV